MQTPSLNRLVLFVGVPALLCLAGCNVADYEKRMLDAQNNLKQRDEEYKLLESPMELVAPKDANTANIFYRAPRGINTMPDNRDKPQAGFLYHYPRKTGMVAPPIQPGALGPTPGLPAPGGPTPGVSPPGGVNPPIPGGPPAGGPPMAGGPGMPAMPAMPSMPGMNDNPGLLEGFVAYRADSAAQASAFQEEFLKQFVRGGAETKKSRHITGPGQTTYDCDTLEFTTTDGKFTYFMAFPRLPGVVMGIAFKAEAGKYSSFQRAFEVSLQTLAVGETAVTAREAYMKDAAWRPFR
jgi:hypothetical protein